MSMWLSAVVSAFHCRITVPSSSSWPSLCRKRGRVTSIEVDETARTAISTASSGSTEEAHPATAVAPRSHANNAVGESVRDFTGVTRSHALRRSLKRAPFAVPSAKIKQFRGGVPGRLFRASLESRPGLLLTNGSFTTAALQLQLSPCPMDPRLS